MEERMVFWNKDYKLVLKFIPRDQPPQELRIPTNINLTIEQYVNN